MTEYLPIVVQTVTLISSMFGGLAWLYKEIKPIILLPEAVNQLTLKVKKLELEIQIAIENKSQLKTLQDLTHDLRTKVGVLTLAVERIDANNKERKQ